MGSIRRNSNPCSNSTKEIAVIQCVDGWEPQIYELWSLGLDGIIRKIPPISQVDIIAGNVGEFMTS